MKQTLLQLTQSILSGLSSDEVNSISDTTESLQVAEIVRQTYFNMMSRVVTPEHDQLVQLDPSLDGEVPVLMYIPEGISQLQWLKYYNTNVLEQANGDDQTHDTNTDIVPSVDIDTLPIPGYEYVTILPITQFIDMVNSFNTSESNVETFTFNDTSNNYNNTYTFYFKNDKQPCYCTILSNYYVIFESFDNTQDSTLQASKTMALGTIRPFFQMVDSFIPNLKDEQFPLLLNEAKSLAYFELKQTIHQKAEQESKRGWLSMQKNKAVIDRPTDFDALPNFGRLSRYFTGTRWFNNGRN